MGGGCFGTASKRCVYFIDSPWKSYSKEWMAVGCVEGGDQEEEREMEMELAYKIVLKKDMLPKNSFFLKEVSS